MKLIVALFLFHVALFPMQPANAQNCGPGVFVDGAKVKSPDDLLDLKKKHSDQQLVVVEAQLGSSIFDGGDFSNVCFYKSDLRKSSWKASKGDRLKFIQSNLSDTDFSWASGSEVSFQWSRLVGADLSNARMPMVKFWNSTIENMDATQADFSAGNFSGNWFANLAGAKFDNANLRGFNFTCGITEEDRCGHNNDKISFVGTDLRKAKFDTGYFAGLDFTDAIIGHTEINWAQIGWFRPSRVMGPVILFPNRESPLFPHRKYKRDQRASRHSVNLSQSDLRQIWTAEDKEKEPWFDCNNARTATEKFICSTRFEFEYYEPAHGAAKMADRDQELNEAYRAARLKKPNIYREQQKWLRYRDKCIKKSKPYEVEHCLNDAYVERIDELWRVAGQDLDIRTGEFRLYLSEGFPTEKEFQKTSLFRRIAPVMAMNSGSFISVLRDKQGRLFAIGEAIGGNAHHGSLRSPSGGMEFDENSGCYGGPAFLGKDSKVRGFVPIVRLRGSRADGAKFHCGEAEFNDYIITGARVGFDRFEKLAIPSSEVKKLLENVQL